MPFPPACPNNVKSFLRLGIETGNLLRLVLKVAVHNDNPVSAAVVQPCCDTEVLAEIPTELEAFDSWVLP